ncbi:MAG: hypothetical protein KJO86_02570, partial [Muriicola sp.]|nr:hypothetical protein [Muriicola sp.]
MADSTLLAYLKDFLIALTGTVRITNEIKNTLVLLSCFSFTALGLAQSGSIQFAQANYLTNESAGTVTLELQRVGGSLGAVSIDIQTFDGTATIVDDYAGIPSP